MPGAGRSPQKRRASNLILRCSCGDSFGTASILQSGEDVLLPRRWVRPGEREGSPCTNFSSLAFDRCPFAARPMHAQGGAGKERAT